MTASTATLRLHDTPPPNPHKARPNAATTGPGPAPADRRKAGTLRLTVATASASLERVPAPRAEPRGAIRAVLDVAGAGARRGTGRLLSRVASDKALGLLVHQALAARPAEPEAQPRARPHSLIHPGQAFCDGAWTRRGRSVTVQRVGSDGDGVLLLAPRPRHGLVAGARPALRATASDEDLGAAVREALASGR